MDTREGKFLPVPHCIVHTEGWEISSALPVGDSLIIDKPTFGSADLVAIMGDYVAQYGEPYVNLEVIGLCTDICVEACITASGTALRIMSAAPKS